MIYHQAQVVAAVVFIGKPFSVVDASYGKLPVTFGQCVGYPAGCFSGSFLCHELYSHGTSFTHLYFVFPSGRRTKETDSFFVFQYVTHLFIISFYRKFPTGKSRVVASQ